MTRSHTKPPRQPPRWLFGPQAGATAAALPLPLLLVKAMKVHRKSAKQASARYEPSDETPGCSSETSRGENPQGPETA